MPTFVEQEIRLWIEANAKCSMLQHKTNQITVLKQASERNSEGDQNVK